MVAIIGLERKFRTKNATWFHRRYSYAGSPRTFGGIDL